MAHHVGRSKKPASPKPGDPVPAHETQHGIVGGPQPTVRFDPENHLAEAVGRQRGYHAHQFGSGNIGAETEEAGIERHQFAFRSSRTAEQGPGEAGQMVDFDDDLGELRIANGDRQRLSGGIEPRIPWRRLAAREPQFAVLDGDAAGRDRLGQGRKTRRQAGLQALQIGFRTGGEIERPDEAGA